MVKCQSCGASYEPIGADGAQYFHACPPLASHEIKAALTSGALQLGVVNRARLQAAQDLDAARKVGDPSPLAVDVLLSSLTFERPNKRDENIVKGAVGKTPAVIRAPGAGVAPVAAVVDVDVLAADAVRP